MNFGTTYETYIIPVTANCSYYTPDDGRRFCPNLVHWSCSKTKIQLLYLLDIGIHILVCRLSERCRWIFHSRIPHVTERCTIRCVSGFSVYHPSMVNWTPGDTVQCHLRMKNFYQYFQGYMLHLLYFRWINVFLFERHNCEYMKEPRIHWRFLK
jgi:hypothetical protein